MLDDAIATDAAASQRDEQNVSKKLSVRLFGRLDVRDSEGVSVLSRSRKTRAVFAILAYSAPRSVDRELLANLLWGDRHRDQARASLRQCLHELRVDLGRIGTNILHCQRNYAMLDENEVWVDTTAVQNATIVTIENLDVVRGPLMQDFINLGPEFRKWIETESLKIETFVKHLCIDALNAAVTEEEVITASQRVLRYDPINEYAWGSLISNYSKMGAHAAAVDAYYRCVKILRTTANVSPSLKIQEIFRSVRQERSPSTSRVPSNFIVSSNPNPTSHVASLTMSPICAISDHLRELCGIFSLSLTNLLFHIKEFEIRIEPKNKTNNLVYYNNSAYFLEGAIYLECNKITLTMRLSDFRLGGQILWSDTFKFSCEDTFLIENISTKIVARVHSAMISNESHRLHSNNSSDRSAQNLVLQAIPAMYRLQKRTFFRAGELLGAAVKLDPDYAAGCAWWAYWHLLLMGQGWAETPLNSIAQTVELTQRAIALNPQDACALTLSGHVQAFTHRRLDEGLALHERALAINSGLSLAWLFSGLAHAYAGYHTEAIRRLQHGKLLNPFDPHGFFFDMGLALSYGLGGQCEMAIGAGNAAFISNPGFSSTLKALASALGHSGDPAERTSALSNLLILEPHFTVGDSLLRSPLARLEDRERFAEGLRYAGLPE